MLEKLTKQFGKKGISFSMQGNLVMFEVESSHAKAKITTHGGCLLRRHLTTKKQKTTSLTPNWLNLL